MRHHTITSATTLLAILFRTSNGQSSSENTSYEHYCSSTDRNTLFQTFRTSLDATLFKDQTNIAAGRERTIVGNTRSGIRRALLQFDVDDLPFDAKITCAEIHLYAAESTTTQHAAYRVTSPWTTTATNNLQGVNGGLAATNDATWVYASYPTVRWDRVGGDFESYPLVGASAAGTVDYAIGYDHYFGGSESWSSAVQQWIDGVRPNYGFAIMGPEDGREGYTIYHGIENDPTTIPKLIVTYTAPSQGYPHLNDGKVTLENSGRANTLTGDDDDSMNNSGRTRSSASTRQTIDSEGTGEIMALILCSFIGVLVLFVGFVGGGNIAR